MNRTITAQAAAAPEAERLHVDHAVAKRLGRWTGRGRVKDDQRPSVRR